VVSVLGNGNVREEPGTRDALVDGACREAAPRPEAPGIRPCRRIPGARRRQRRATRARSRGARSPRRGSSPSAFRSRRRGVLPRARGARPASVAGSRGASGGRGRGDGAPSAALPAVLEVAALAGQFRTVGADRGSPSRTAARRGAAAARRSCAAVPLAPVPCGTAGREAPGPCAAGWLGRSGARSRCSSPARATAMAFPSPSAALASSGSSVPCPSMFQGPCQRRKLSAWVAARDTR